MDRKRTQRILGILVIIGLVIILFPLLFGKNDSPTQTTSIAPPLFPDQTQAEETASTATDNSSQSAPVVNQQRASRSESANTAEESTEPQLVEPSSASNNSDMSVTPSPISDTVIQERMDTTPGVVLPNPLEETQSLKKALPSANIAPAVENHPQSEPQIKTTSAKKVTPKVKSSNSHETIAKLNTNAWAVQMGSFKNKQNARVLADRLRSAGFKAFTKEVTSPQGSVQTRVYIGPEFKQASAIKVNAEVQKLMNIQGMVVSYRPLAL